jgi:hypothetical protein
VTESTPHRTLFYIIFGGILVALAVGSVLVTSHNNRQQQHLVGCGAQVVQQAINSLKARDAAQIQVNSATRIIVSSRQEAYHALADAIESRSNMSRLNKAMQDYDVAVAQYQTAVDADTEAIRTAPLPAVDCLTNRQRQSAGVP